MTPRWRRATRLWPSDGRPSRTATAPRRSWPRRWPRQEGALAERDRIADGRDHVAAERDALLGQRDHARRAHDADVAALERDVAEREAFESTIEQLRLERDDAVASRGAALVMRNAANAPPSYRRESNRLLHFLPALVVVVVALVVALLLHVI